ncbi:MAG: PilZ domain-containing protein [bacterium]
MKYDTTIIKDIRSFLKVNQRIEIDFDHPDFLDEYTSRVEKIKEDLIYVALPEIRHVPEKTHGWVFYVYKDQRYGFETQVEGYEGGPSVRMILASPREILRLQRRKYFRVFVDIPVTCRAPTLPMEEPESIFYGTILNISAGGVLMETDREIPVGSELVLFFSLAQEMDIDDIPSKVIRCGIVKKTKKHILYEYGIEFYSLDGRLRDAIMRFVFKQLIELNRQVKE